MQHFAAVQHPSFFFGASAAVISFFKVPDGAALGGFC